MLWCEHPVEDPFGLGIIGEAPDAFEAEEGALAVVYDGFSG